MSDNKVMRIEISFPVAVEMPPGFERALDGLVHMITDKYREDNPDRVMWPAGCGSKPIWNEPHEPKFDANIYVIDVVEREKTRKEKRREAR
jgi:hypothetical protein